MNCPDVYKTITPEIKDESMEKVKVVKYPDVYPCKTENEGKTIHKVEVVS